MSDDPPSVKRPHCAAATIVLPDEYVSGSTIVACWLDAFVNGSVAMIVTATFAEATSVSVSAAVAAKPKANASHRRTDENPNSIKPPLPRFRPATGRPSAESVVSVDEVQWAKRQRFSVDAGQPSRAGAAPA